MHEILIRYLGKHKNFNLPGIGRFELVSEMASLDFVNKTIYPPKQQIVFHPEKKVNSGALAQPVKNETQAFLNDNKNNFPGFLSRHLNMPESSALSEFEQYAGFVRSTLEKNGVYELNGIGSLQQNEKGIYLDNAFSTEKFYEPLHAEQVIRENATHSVRVGEEEKTSEQMKEFLHRDIKKDNWWIAAVILAVAGIAAIAYYYMGMN
ncbi:MAG: hypothetical protein WAU24_04925 [Chitinophagaceae bacterium]